MFSGLVRHIGRVEHFSGEVVAIKSDLSPKIGASIAVNGACLSVTRFENGVFWADLSSETQGLIALENLRGRVHLEEALALGERLDGHLVQGHIDCVGELRRVEKTKSGFDFWVDCPPQFTPLIAPKGSIAIDGVSLTVNETWEGGFRLTIIPHTFENTLFCAYKPQRRLNIETDIINRAVFHALSCRGGAENGGANGGGAKNSAKSTAKSTAWRDIDSILAGY